MLDGAFPKGGPLIATTTASASLGASVLSVAASLTGDFLLYGAVSKNNASEAQPFDLNDGTANDNRVLARMLAGAHLEFQPWAGAVNQPGPSLIANCFNVGRNVLLVGRRNGKYISAAKDPSSNITIRDDASGTGAVPTVNALAIGCAHTGSAQVNGTIESAVLASGTFADADITSLLQAA
jgi:hypothetical protein